ncbi:hypothetical protein M404DRAFT_1009167 [Pisolithus tinctorius Marx 270]|uniref:Uncharacterized protein n=1 Tax=Pisolithus tinctorius Marx 270 TaxID=870435 RepID=A0A0C3J608_PISTI|nr:hypothetical protein M404DRAFT_1009167 [Pisolithus tinctorius Marx 270]
MAEVRTIQSLRLPERVRLVLTDIEEPADTERSRRRPRILGDLETSRASSSRSLLDERSRVLCGGESERSRPRCTEGDRER